ncbi:MAG: hypothetical protein Q9186_006536 [Xanthomendoza sp. 1 TL-2023]
MEAIQMQPLRPSPVQEEETSTTFPEIKAPEPQKKKTLGGRIGLACKKFAQDGIWGLVDEPSRPIVPVTVPRAARQRSSLAREASISRQREEYEKALSLERQSSQNPQQRPRGNSNASSSRRFREMFRPTAHRPAAPKSLCTIIREEQQLGHSIYAATEIYNSSRKPSVVDSAAPGETETETETKKKTEKEMKKAKSMGQLSAANGKAGSEKKGGRKMEEGVRSSKSDANLKFERNRDSGDSGYVSRKYGSAESARPVPGQKQKPTKKASRSSSRYSQSESAASSSSAQQQLSNTTAVDMAVSAIPADYLVQVTSVQSRTVMASTERLGMALPYFGSLKVADEPADMDHPYSAAQSWSYRVPSPPRVFIPPPAMDFNGRPDLQFHHHPNSHDFESSGFGNSEFLKTVTYGNFMTSHTMLNWQYEWRRKAQQILPFLFLGPITAARDPNFLRDNGITMLLAVRDIKSVNAKLLGSRVAQELGIPCSTVDTSGNQELIAAFPRGIETINAHLSDMYKRSQLNPATDTASVPGKVLVFCETGNERSAAMVVAYVMAMYSVDVVKAIQVVQAQRFATAFTDSLKTLLETYDSMLQAKRDVVQCGRYSGRGNASTGLGPPTSSQGKMRKCSKRTLDDAYDDEMDMDGEVMPYDEARFARREGAAPFLDDILRDRRARKAPRRLEDELAEGGEGVESARSISRHGAYHGPVIAYNPNLPPAQFPTLDPRKDNPCDSHAHVNHIHHTQHRTLVPSEPSSSHQHLKTTSLSKPTSTKHTDNQHLDGLDPRLAREFHLANVDQLAMIPFRGRPQDDTSNGPDNHIWSSNMQKFDKWGDMTEEELIMDEMATSDEEGPSKVKDTPRCPSWDGIPLRLRIDMIAVASGNDKAIEPALRRLRLDSTQQYTAIEDYRQHLERDHEDDRNIAKHQNLMHRTLLYGPKAYGTQAGFRTLSSVHLYQNLDCSDVGVRPPDVAAARAYMEFCGLPADFLDSFTSPAQATSELSMKVEDKYDAKFPLSAAIKEANEDVPQALIPLYPSTPDSHQRSNGSSPQDFFTPKAQLYQTPPLLQQSKTSQRPISAVQPPVLNGRTAHQTMHRAVEVNERNQAPLMVGKQGHGWKDINTSAYTAPSPHSPPTPSRNLIIPHQQSRESNIEHQAKRKRPNIANGSAVNGHKRYNHANSSPSTATQINGTQHHTNGHAGDGASSRTTSSQITVDVSGQTDTSTAQNGVASAGENDNGVPAAKNGDRGNMNSASGTKKKAGKSRKREE